MIQSRARRWIAGALLVGLGVLLGSLTTPLVRAWSAPNIPGGTTWADMHAACTAFMQSPEGQAHHRAMMQWHAQYGLPVSPPATEGGAKTP